MGSEMAVAETRALSAQDIRAQVNLIQEVMKAVMKKDTHYGTIPGCPKPSLYKPGAEKLLVTFRIASEPVVEDLSTADEVRYRVTRRGTHIGSGSFLGSGVGECSSNEEKYRWRKAVCDEEFDETPEDRRREKWARGRDGAYRVKQVRTNPADVANTVLKMADKRGYVALALNVTAASDIFTQDIEDLPEDLRHEEAAQPTEHIPGPEEKSEVNVASGLIEDVSIKEGVGKTGKPWKKYGVKVSGEYYGTFDEEAGTFAIAAHKGGVKVKLSWEPDGKFKNLLMIGKAE